MDPPPYVRPGAHFVSSPVRPALKQALVDGVPIEVASELAGHVSIDTTSLYSTQELTRKIKAVQGMKHRNSNAAI